MTTTTTKRNPREEINHGHNDWDGSRWVPQYHTWCGACRAVKAELEAYIASGFPVITLTPECDGENCDEYEHRAGCSLYDELLDIS